MAKNLRAKSSPTIKLYVYDIASTRADQLAAESEPANGHIVKCMSVAEVVQNSVSTQNQVPHVDLRNRLRLLTATRM